MKNIHAIQKRRKRKKNKKKLELIEEFGPSVSTILADMYAGIRDERFGQNKLEIPIRIWCIPMGPSGSVRCMLRMHRILSAEVVVIGYQMGFRYSTNHHSRAYDSFFFFLCCVAFHLILSNLLWKQLYCRHHCLDGYFSSFSPARDEFHLVMLKPYFDQHFIWMWIFCVSIQNEKREKKPSTKTTTTNTSLHAFGSAFIPLWKRLCGKRCAWLCILS